MSKLLHSLKFQIGLAIALLTLLFAASTLYSLHVIDRQHGDNVLVHLAGRLQFDQQQLTVQAMRYEENAPRDYPSYYRDLRLYFEDLKRHREALSQTIEAFAANRFDGALTGAPMAMAPRLSPDAHRIANELADAWRAFLAGLDERIGPDPAEPRLEWAAQWISEHHAPLETLARRLTTEVENAAAASAERAALISRLLLLSALVVAVGIAAWFYRRVLAPLTQAVEGFKQVANGDFAYKVPIAHDNEIGWMADSFNHLAERMDALRKLLTRLEQGADLEATVRTLSESLPPLIPVDWIGVLIRSPDGRMHLETAFGDGRPDTIGRLSFTPERTLLEDCVNSRKPLHIGDVREMAALSPDYVFLQRLAELGRRDAIMLPIGAGTTIQGVAVFASRYPGHFRSEHLALLRNLGVLLGVSLGRTIQLAETSRLAAIGQFASGIAHEIRNPLATISLALEHLDTLDDLPDGARKRLALAGDEIARLERLLADILTYAKPLALERVVADLPDLVTEAVAAEPDAGPRVDWQPEPCPPVSVDRDRFRQVLVNLIRNARQAAPPDTVVQIRCHATDRGWAALEIANGGEPIPDRILERAFEPFVTARREGTGLGLAIVQRIVRAHGGQVELTSDADHGTRVLVRLPAIAAAPPGRAGSQAAEDVA